MTMLRLDAACYKNEFRQEAIQIRSKHTAESQIDNLWKSYLVKWNHRRLQNHAISHSKQQHGLSIEYVSFLTKGQVVKVGRRHFVGRAEPRVLPKPFWLRTTIDQL